MTLDKYQARLRTAEFTLGIRADNKHVTGIAILPPAIPALAPPPDTLAYLACVQLSTYLENPRFQFDLPIKLAGSMHQLQVWEAMRRIPAGQVRTYGELAEDVGSNARAVGTACGQNPVPIVVPCHRIVAVNGLGGFMGGTGEDTLSIKRWLLKHEGWAGVSQGELL
jgi:methylated-DNA-[protein]-cysteine S-methyltransferase